MENEKITTDTIIEYLKRAVEEKRILPPEKWIEAAEKLNILRSDDDDNLVGLAQKVAEIKVEWISKGTSVAEAKLRADASPVYRDYLMQKMKCERITEFIRIEKLKSRLKSEEFGGY